MADSIRDRTAAGGKATRSARKSTASAQHIQIIGDANVGDFSSYTDIVRESGLFDGSYYTANCAEVAESGIDPVLHFCREGYATTWPNHLFDGEWYEKTYPDALDGSLPPFLHYVVTGEAEGLRPSRLFDPVWYREQYKLQPGERPLAHYLRNRYGAFSPIPEFDARFYLQSNHDLGSSRVDPLAHYLHRGYREGRDPSPAFDTKFYTRRYLGGVFDENPLLHFLENRHLGGFVGRPQELEDTIPAQVRRFTRPGPHFQEARPIGQGAGKRAKLLAYYLTQFHAIPENDRWWGEGFTEWTNIARGVPRFKDHYQPRIPRDLGFYSLDDIETMRRQVALAKGAGIHGFVFYYYWFNGKRLLEKPLERFLSTPDIDMPFCLMWANENWTRRWDGMEAEVLISQNYFAGDDELLVADYIRHFRDPRYIRVQGRPLLMIYRPRLIPDSPKAIERWRALFRKAGEDPILILGQSFDDFDPLPFGLDGAIEFPPHKVSQRIPIVTDEVELLDEGFAGKVYSYDDVVRSSIEEPAPAYPLIKTVTPSWDNDARRQGSGLVLHGSTPAKYEAWLAETIAYAQKNPFFGEAFVCINAWNEWCEGAYLEPDLHFGSAYLNATGRAVAGLFGEAVGPRLLLVGHDAFHSGSQQLLLNIGKTLKGSFGFEIEFLLLDGGALEEDYRKIAPTTVAGVSAVLKDKIASLIDRGFSAAIVNTTAAGQAAKALAEAGVHTVLLVHELPRILHEKNLLGIARAGMDAAHKVVFPANSVRHNMTTALALPADEKFLVRPQGSYKELERSQAAANQVRQELGIKPRERMVLGAGFADMRKGFDLFLQLWRLLQGAQPRVHFCWVGGIDPSLLEWIGPEITLARATGTFHAVGFRDDVDGFFSAADAFVLTSREDPFPTVVLEAMSVGLPVVAFEGSGGIPDLLKEKKLGHVVSYCDVPAMTQTLKEIFGGSTDAKLAERAIAEVDESFRFRPYVRDLVRLALPALTSVSVAVPNYNYARCMPERLGTVFDQSYPVEEVIVLDDASTDNSVDVIVDVAEQHQRDVSLIINETNSGSVFAQWALAAETAVGEFIWIAEADDLSESAFLASLLAVMRTDPNIQIGFCDSRAIDGKGQPVFESYKPYYATIETGALQRSQVFDGGEFATRYLSVKNTILNVSSVVWRRESLLEALQACKHELEDLRLAGDWRLYLEVLAASGAKIAYVADPLNTHRRHEDSVTGRVDARRHIDEIRTMHSVAHDLFGSNRVLAQSQTSYIQEVTAQLLDRG